MNIFSRIVTPPKSCALKNGENVLLFGGNTSFFKIENNANTPLSAFAESKIRRCIKSITGSDAEGEGVVISLKLGAPSQQMDNIEQGYSITAEEGNITLCGFGDRGLLYAAVTLCQMLSIEGGEISLPCFEITDWPDMAVRGHNIECRFGSNVMELEDWKSIIDDMVEKKENTLTVGVYGCWTVQFDGIISEYLYVPFEKYPQLKTPMYTKYYSPTNKKWVQEFTLPPMFEKDFFGDLVVYGKQCGIEVFPFFNTYGHNSLLPRTFPEISAKHENGEPTSNGLCTRNEKTYELLFELLDTIIDKYLVPNGITSIDIGLDEVGDADYVIGIHPDDVWRSCPQFCKCEKCRDASPRDLFIDHVIKMISHCKEKGMKNVYICEDMFYRRGRSADRDLLQLLHNRLEQADLLDVTVLNWWNYVETEELLVFGPEDIVRSNIRGVTKPMNGYYHWHLYYPRVNNSYYLIRSAYQSKCEGFISYSGWDNMFDCNNSAQAAFSWNFEGTGAQTGAIRRYCERVFPTLADETVEAFENLNACVAGGRTTLSTITLLEKYMSYYFFSYIQKGQPYPRNFPGEGVSKFLDNYDEATALLDFVYKSSARAKELFLKASRTDGCDKYFARRYGWEADNIFTLCEDYKALLYMHSLSAKGLDESSAEEIKNLALARKNARLNLMQTAEEIKESYLLSSHMRNQSIFMQIFADIANYIEKTPLNELALDFTDLTNIGSAEFKNLR